MIKNKWSKLLRNKNFILNLILSIIFVIAAGFITKLAGAKAELIKAPPLPDLLHQIIPIIDITLLTTTGFLVLQFIFWGYFILKKPEKIPYAVKVYGIFLIFRALFISLTAIGAPAIRIDDISVLTLLSGMYFTQDLFPSGHVGFAFIAYLIIENKKLKYFMLIGTLAMAASVLLPHTHYSIDVLGALFVAYGSIGFYNWIKNLMPSLFTIKK